MCRSDLNRSNFLIQRASFPTLEGSTRLNHKYAISGSIAPSQCVVREGANLTVAPDVVFFILVLFCSLSIPTFLPLPFLQLPFHPYLSFNYLFSPTFSSLSSPTFSSLPFIPYLFSHTISSLPFLSYLFIPTFPPLPFPPYLFIHTFSSIPFHPLPFLPYLSSPTFSLHIIFILIISVYCLTLSFPKRYTPSWPLSTPASIPKYPSQTVSYPTLSFPSFPIPNSQIFCS